MGTTSSPGLRPPFPFVGLQSWGRTGLGAPCLMALTQPWHCCPISRPAFWREATPHLQHILGTRPGEQGQAGQSPPLPPRAKNHLWGWQPFQPGSSSSSPPFPLGDARCSPCARRSSKASPISVETGPRLSNRAERSGVSYGNASGSEARREGCAGRARRKLSPRETIPQAKPRLPRQRRRGWRCATRGETERWQEKGGIMGRKVSVPLWTAVK